MSNDTPPPPPPEQPPPPPPPAGPYAPAYGAAAPGGTPAAAAPGGAPGRGMAITSLVLGILALLGVAIPLLNIGSLIMAIVGLVLGILALRKYAAGKGLPISGVIINAIAAFLALIFVILYAVGFAAWFTAIEDELTPVPPMETTEPADPGDDGATEPDPVDPGDGLFEVTTPDSGPGSFDEPLANGQTVILTDFGTDTWEVTVDAVDLSADEAVLAVNEFNEPPEPGTQYAVMTLTVTKVAGEPADPWFAIEVEFLSSASTTHTQFDALVVDPDPSFFDLGELSEGDTATGNVTVLVPSADVENGRWLVYSYFDSEGFYFQAQ
ncbi:hypothetical protein EV140_1761 [Microcella alkaliphila]|uniref:DUF4190 domain-containing protein n=1 Tax=Microcella alkaliphila TaxID=279828 RepID=A0A4V2FMW1_9MICO|nr:DUF4190 domain-containing protein [Microcella alkaliphila]RZT59159.1 hypothetical protein EV140_1761 [Microcella alkaliphila]